MIQSALLPDTLGFIDGCWSAAEGGGRLPVVDRATGEHLADVPDMSADDAARAADAAERAARSCPEVADRRRWLLEIARLLAAHKQELAHIITHEQGKPLKESAVEVEYAAGFFSFFADQLHHLNAHELPERIRQLRWTIHRRPAGVAALITPWNFPLALLAKKLAAAIGAGCAVVAKPSEITPLAAIAMWRLIEPLQLPAGMLNLVIGRPVPIGKALCSHPGIRLISFTGSTAVGRWLFEHSAASVKRLALELGGNAPYIVMDDADPVAAADALIPNKFRCGGQTCVCANRIYVHRAIEPAFLQAICDRVTRLRVGNGLDPLTDVGPLINRAAFEKVHRHVRDALERGATRHVGDDRPAPPTDHAAFFSPTVLAGVRADMLLSREETFGPVVAIETFDTEDDAIALANGTPYGLAAYLFTRDADRAQRMIRQLHFGHVGLNTGSGPTPEAPFGGMKQSGFGREGGIDGLLEFTEAQTVAAA